MAIKRLVTPGRFIGLSTDTKPTDGATSVRPGATFYEYNTGVFYITYDGTNWVIKPDASGRPKEVRLAKAIAGGATPYSANDVVNDTTCTTTATSWLFLAMASAVGGYGVIKSATIFSESENISPRLTLFLFNAVPTGALADNVANTNPILGDRTKYIGKIEFPALKARSASCASEASATPSTVGGLPLWYKCAAAVTTIYGVLVTEDIFTQTATDDIEITLQIEHL